jgi:ethanolamine utilization protein EutQ (cupin superfamily)
MFTPIIKTSTNVMEDLALAASSRGIPVESVDFDLLSYETLYKGSEDDEWQPMESCNLLEYTTENEIRTSSFLLRQEYKIRIREAQPYPHLDLRFTIATDKYKSKVVIVIDPQSTIALKKGIQEWIKEALVRKLLRHGLLIGLYDQTLDREINRLLLKIQKEGLLSESYRFVMGEFFPPLLPTNDTIILHYKNGKETKSLIDGVQPDDLVLEYIFPKEGRDGRGCDGNFISVPIANRKYAGAIVIDKNTITSTQDDHSIRFYAKVSGFVERKNGIFLISQILKIESADFKKTGSIEAGFDKDISLEIKQNFSDKDAVGSGVSINVQKLDIQGTVGGNATIQACEVNIGAQTHKRSQINVSEVANIHLHRGNLKAKEANIDILEAGKVEADTIRIQKMMGGEVIARHVFIEVLYSNARITASESIVIGTIEGEGNKLTIDPHSLEAYHESIAVLEANVRSKAFRLKEQQKELLSRQLSFKDKNSRIKVIQKRIVDTKKSGAEPMKADLVRIQQFKREVEELRVIAETLNNAQLELQMDQDNLDKLYDADLHAVITHNGLHNGKNRVVFIDPRTHQEYGVTPNGKVTHIRLRKEGDVKKILLET